MTIFSSPVQHRKTDIISAVSDSLPVNLPVFSRVLFVSVIFLRFGTRLIGQFARAELSCLLASLRLDCMLQSIGACNGNNGYLNVKLSDAAEMKMDEEADSSSGWWICLQLKCSHRNKQLGVVIRTFF